MKVAKTANMLSRKVVEKLNRPFSRWLTAGGSFFFINAFFMWIFVEKFHLAVFVATLISAESCTVLRFLVNENWVFQTRQHCWFRLGQFHVANAAAFIIWLAVTNLLVLKGVHYQLASVAGVGCSFGASFISNFFWVWRKHHRLEELLFWKRKAK